MTTFHLYLPDPLHNQLKEYANRNGVSMNEFIMTLLANKLATLETQKNASKNASKRTGESNSAATITPSSETTKENLKTQETWTDRKNARRCELIDKRIQGTITDAELLELERLQQQMREYVDKLAPLDLDNARRLHKELLEKKQKRDEKK